MFPPRGRSTAPAHQTGAITANELLCEQRELIAVAEHVVPADELAWEARRRSPDPTTRALLAEVVVDRVGNVGNRDRRPQRDGRRCDFVAVAKVDPDQAGESPGSFPKDRERRVVEDRDRNDVETPGRGAEFAAPPRGRLVRLGRCDQGG